MTYGQVEKPVYQLLWEIKGNGIKPSYLFGTLHSNDVRLFQFPDSLYPAFVNSDAIVIETDVTQIYEDYDVRLNFLDFNLFDKKQAYSTSNRATQTVYGSEDGRPQFLDAFFQQTAFCAGKKFFPLESVQDQLNLKNNKEIFNERLLVSSVFSSKEKLFQTYLDGDLPELTKILKGQFSKSPTAYDKLITQRNIIMANGLDTLMRKMSVFCAIGAGHLYGNDGVLQLLKKKGFQLRMVSASYANSTESFKSKMYSWNSYNISNDSLNFNISLSGKPFEIKDESKYHIIYQELGQGNTFELIVHNDPNFLDDNRTKFIENRSFKTLEFTNGDAQIIDGLVHSSAHGIQRKQIVQLGELAYELICYGGNKFMHSNRPEQFFKRFSLINTTCN